MAKWPRLDGPWGQESFLHMMGHQWMLQSPGSPCNISATPFLQLLPLALERRRPESSAVLLKCSCRRHCLGGSCHVLRSWHLFPEG